MNDFSKERQCIFETERGEKEFYIIISETNALNKSIYLLLYLSILSLRK